MQVWFLGFWAFNTTFNNVSVIYDGQFPDKTTDLPQVTDRLYHSIKYMQEIKLLLFNAVCFIEGENTNIIIFGLIYHGLYPTTLKVSITPPMK